MSGSYLVLASLAIIRSTKTIRIAPEIKKRGSKANRNTLKMLFEGAKYFISVSAIKQSNEKNDSFGELTFSTCEKMELKFDGMPTLNVNAVEINWM